MMLYKELQPADAYQVKLSHPFSSYDRQLLTLFYQPLIGAEAMSLFMTLWADAENDQCSEQNHYHLMNVLSFALGPIFHARISLEAIGLLRTYRKQTGEQRTFLYELLPPLDAKSFFEDPLLSTFLFSKIGEQPYRKLRARFLEELPDEGFVDISRTFLDVFQPSHYAYAIELTAGQQFQSKGSAQPLPFKHSNFDFELFYNGLSEQMIPKSALASVSQELIAKLAFLYELTPLDMQKVMMIAMDETLQLTEERVRKAAAEFYKMNRSTTPPKLQTLAPQTTPAEQPASPPQSREEELIEYLESTSPTEMLRDLNDAEPFQVDVQLAERLINTYNLPVGVVNVLFQYMILRNDGKITNNFAERVASHWRNKKVSNAKAALEISRKEHDQYMDWLKGGKQKTAKRKVIREEKVPEWFYKKGQQKKKQPKTDFNVEEERQKLLRELGMENAEVK